jgi:hypothetical protein
VSVEIPKITGSTICPFLNVSEYLAIRPKSTATKPLFCHYKFPFERAISPILNNPQKDRVNAALNILSSYLL